MPVSLIQIKLGPVGSITLILTSVVGPSLKRVELNILAARNFKDLLESCVQVHGLRSGILPWKRELIHQT
jgi:hypothetical protein